MPEIFQGNRKIQTLSCAAIVPALNPGQTLVALVSQLRLAGFDDVVIVDDGSGAAAQSVFRQAAQDPAVVVLRHSGNRGKGAALRTGLRYFLDRFPSLAGVVTLDADGQHAASEAARIAQACQENRDCLVIGARSFDGLPGPAVPLRNWIGNNVSRFVFRLVLQRPLRDTQSGLRGIPRDAIPALLKLSGERYEYETNMLLWARRAGVPIREVPIETVYLDGNQASHFRPLVDSMRIYFVLLRFCSASLAAAALDLALFTLLWRGTGRFGWSFVLARFASSLLNFTLNRDYVFRNRAARGPAALRYYGLAAAVGLTSYAGSRLLAAAGLAVLGAKIAADLGLSIVSFAIQRGFVFRRFQRAAAE